MIAPADESEELLAARMQEVRRRGHSNAYQLRVGVDRVSDWKEHVKAHPLPAIFASAFVGYLATSKLLGNGSSSSEKIPQGVHMSEQKADEQVAKASISAGVAGFVGSMLSNALRQYARGYVENYVRNLARKD
jgi:hypothetical protein